MKKTGIIVTIIALVLLGGTAVAQTSGVINACVGPDGTLRVAEECRTTEKPLTWNAVGPQGPAGADGVSGYEIVQRTFNVDGTSDTVEASGDPGGWAVRNQALALYWVLCPEGKVPLGGGMDATVTYGGRLGGGTGQDWPEPDRWVHENLSPSWIGNGESAVYKVYATCVAAR